MIIIQVINKVFFSPEDFFLDTSTFSISTSLRGTGLLWRSNFFFPMSVLLNVKNYLPIFIYDNKFFMFYNVLLFWSNQHFPLSLWSQFC